MTLSTLDPGTALVVIDLQVGIVGVDAVHPMEDIIANNVALLEAFRGHGLPVALVNVDGVPPGRIEEQRPGGFNPPPGWDELIPELDQQPDDITVTKKSRGAFTNTDLDDQLRARGVTQIVLTGISTSAGVEATARHAHELGYNVTLAVDAMTDRDADAHTHSLDKTFPKIGESGTTHEVIDLLGATRS